MYRSSAILDQDARLLKTLHTGVINDALSMHGEAYDTWEDDPAALASSGITMHGVLFGSDDCVLIQVCCDLGSGCATIEDAAE